MVKTRGGGTWPNAPAYLPTTPADYGTRECTLQIHTEGGWGPLFLSFCMPLSGVCVCVACLLGYIGSTGKAKCMASYSHAHTANVPFRRKLQGPAHDAATSFAHAVHVVAG